MSSQNVVPIGLRLPPEVRSWIEASARKNLRSLNSEIVLAIMEKIERSSQAEGDAK